MTSITSCIIWWNLVKSLVASILPISVIRPASFSFSTTGNLFIFLALNALLMSENLVDGDIIMNSLSITSLTFVFFEMAPFTMSLSLMTAIGLSPSTTTRLLTDFEVISFAACRILAPGSMIITSFVIMFFTFIILPEWKVPVQIPVKHKYKKLEKHKKHKHDVLYVPMEPHIVAYRMHDVFFCGEAQKPAILDNRILPEPFCVNDLQSLVQLHVGLHEGHWIGHYPAHWLL